MLNIRVIQLVTAFAVIASTTSARAQSVSTESMNCVNGDPAFKSGDTRQQQELLDRLLWRKSYADYIGITGKSGALAAFDSIRVRSESLFAQTAGHGLDAAADSVLRRMERVRGNLVNTLDADGKSLKENQTMRVTSLMLTTPITGDVRTMLGGSVEIRFDDSVRVRAVAVCAGANTALNFLRFLNDPAMNTVAERYAQSASRWKLYEEQGYSMTFVERAFASCRVPVIGWIASPVRQCSRDPKRSLDPPTHQWLFFHPAAGLAPLLKRDSAFKEAVVIELYGYVYHSYSAKKVATFGASLASSHVESGPSRLGALLITPKGTIGVFWRKSDRPFYTVSADVLGWVPGVRSAAAALRNSQLAEVLGIFAEKQ